MMNNECEIHIWDDISGLCGRYCKKCGLAEIHVDPNADFVMGREV